MSDNMSHSQQKPKIKSIVSTNFPIKVLKNGKRLVMIEDIYNANVTSVDENYSMKTPDEVFSSASIPSEVLEAKLNNKSKQLSDSESFSDESILENHSKPVTDKANECFEVQECADKLEKLNLKSLGVNSTKVTKTQDKENSDTLKKCLSDDKIKNCVYTVDKNDSGEDSDIEITKIVHYEQPLQSNKINQKMTYATKSNLSHTHVNESKKQDRNIPSCTENKENYQSNYKYNKNEVSLNLASALKDATNPAHKTFKNDSVKKSTNLNGKLQIIPKKNLLKPNKMTEKNLQIKKATVFNIDGQKCNVVVQPSLNCKGNCSLGIICKNCSANRSSESNCVKKNLVSQNLLSQPEYNSTICVMKKLKEVEKEKLVPDLEHLPSAYKNFIKGKVSSALEFAPYETVYKDLINLSLGEDKLPARLTRSKDPEPRDKDITPNLSDFYNPKCIEQYFVIANPITPNPVNVNTLSAFKINKKINTWKSCRDSY